MQHDGGPRRHEAFLSNKVFCSPRENSEPELRDVFSGQNIVMDCLSLLKVSEVPDGFGINQGRITARSELMDPPLIMVAHRGIPDHEHLGPRRLWSPWQRCRVRNVPSTLSKRSEHRGIWPLVDIGAHRVLKNPNKHPEHLDEVSQV